MLIPLIEAAEITYHQLNWWKVLTTNFETKNEKWLYSATLFRSNSYWLYSSLRDLAAAAVVVLLERSATEHV